MKHNIKFFSNFTHAELASQIIASANSQEKATLTIKFHEQMPEKERLQFEEDFENSLLQFEEPTIMNYINLQWENNKLHIKFIGWNGKVLLSPDGFMFIRPYCKVSILNQIENDNRYFTPIVIR